VSFTVAANPTFALTPAETRQFISYTEDLLKSPVVREMQQFTQHGQNSCYTHCIYVAYFAYVYALRTKAKVNLKDLARGALLHDLFLYDWHIKDTVHPHNLHGFKHPTVALRNAEANFVLDDVQRDIIKHHMWPLTPAFPHCKETYIITAADKYSAFVESLCIVPPAARQFSETLAKIG
jgi:uncharacterized protein